MAKSSVEFACGAISVVVGAERLFGLFECIAALVLLAHAIHNEHDEENGSEYAYDSAAHNARQYARFRDDDEKLGARRLVSDWLGRTRATRRLIVAQCGVLLVFVITIGIGFVVVNG